MTRRKIRLGRCFRCVYTWRIRKRYPRMCPRCKSRFWNVPRLRPVVLGTGLGMDEIVTPHRTRILRLAQKYGAKRLRVFGSVRRREATGSSDIDILVDWIRIPSLLDHAALANELEAALGRPVDLVNHGDLHWAMAPHVEAEALPP